MSQTNINETSMGKESQKDLPKQQKSQNKNESNIEYDDVYVVEERSMPTNELENEDQDEFNEELSLSLSSIDEDTDIFPDSYDALKMESERSKKKLEKKEKEKLTKLLDEKLNFNPKTIKRAEVVEDFIRNFLTNSNLQKNLIKNILNYQKKEDSMIIIQDQLLIFILKMQNQKKNQKE